MTDAQHVGAHGQRDAVEGSRADHTAVHRDLAPGPYRDLELARLRGQGGRRDGDHGQRGRRRRRGDDGGGGRRTRGDPDTFERTRGVNRVGSGRDQGRDGRRGRGQRQGRGRRRRRRRGESELGRGRDRDRRRG